MFYFSKKKKSGYVVLMTILLLSAIGMAISLFLLSSGVNNAKIIIAKEQGMIARHLADACGEKALDNLRKNINYSGNESISFTEGSCFIRTVLGTGNSNRTIQTTGTKNDIIRKEEIKINTVSPQINITSWKEVSDFE